MIHIETDRLEELRDKLKSSISSSEEAWYGLRSTRSEMLQDDMLAELYDLTNIQNYMDSSIKTCQRINDILKNLEVILGVMPGEIKQLEQNNRKKIEKIDEFVLAYAENFQAASGDHTGNRIETPIGQIQSSLVEAVLYGKTEEIQQEELAAVQRVLKDHYQFEKVVHDDVDSNE